MLNNMKKHPKVTFIANLVKSDSQTEGDSGKYLKQQINQNNRDKNSSKTKLKKNKNQKKNKK